MNDIDLCYLPATQALELFKKKELSPVDLLQAQISRAEAVEPTVNALTFTYFDEALEQARAAEQRYMKGDASGVLDGLLIGIKDESYIAGKPTSSGSLSTEGFIPDTTSIINARILAEGGIVHTRTATPEFSCAGYCHSRRWGVTRNP